MSSRRKPRKRPFTAKCSPTSCSRSCAASRPRSRRDPWSSSPAMQLRAENLEAHLKKSLGPLYVVHGDEALLALEAADAIRAAARAKGYEERELFIAERGFDWGELLHAGLSRSLFGGSKIVEL